MPELAEIKIMADYINQSIVEDLDFTTICFSESANKRGLGIVQPTDLQIFKIKAHARGKELMLHLIQGGETFMKIRCSMGMSGYWDLAHQDTPPKHTHLKFNAVGGISLCLVDVRRFAKWKVADEWSQNRGPSPLSEFKEFKQNIIDNLSKREFSKPIHLVLMNQQYFNGIGNYLRAEIMYKADQDPWQEARSAILENPPLLDLCSQLPKEAYILGGGQLKDWESPFMVPAGGFRDWIQCYGKGESFTDKNGRTCWYKTRQFAYSS
jgi:endonuclease VIII-like 1